MDVNTMVIFITGTIIICICFRYISPDKLTSDFIKALCIVSIATFFVSNTPKLTIAPFDDIQQTIAETKSISESITTQFEKIISNSLPRDDNYD